MENDKKGKVSLTTFFLVLAIIVICIMAYYIYKMNSDKQVAIEEVDDLNNQITKLETTVNELEDTMNTIAEDEIEEENTNVSNQNNTLNEEEINNTYSKDNIEFEYPTTFKSIGYTFEEYGFEAIEDKDNNRFQIQSENINESKTLKDAVIEEENLLMPDGDIYRTVVKGEEYITLDSGTTGYRFECTTRDNAYQIIFMTQKSNNEVYKFAFTINDKSEYDNYIEIANKIINSIKIK